MANYYLRDSNDFYGKKGSVIPDMLYDKLPLKHKQLFMTSDEFRKLQLQETKSKVKTSVGDLEDFYFRHVNNPQPVRRNDNQEVLPDPVAFERLINWGHGQLRVPQENAEEVPNNPFDLMEDIWDEEEDEDEDE